MAKILISFDLHNEEGGTAYEEIKKTIIGLANSQHHAIHLLTTTYVIYTQAAPVFVFQQLQDLISSNNWNGDVFVCRIEQNSDYSYSSNDEKVLSGDAIYNHQWSQL